MQKLKLPGARKRPADAVAATGRVAATVDQEKPKKPKRIRQPRVKPSRIRSAWRIFLDALTDYSANWKGYTKILLIVGLPTNLLAFFSLGTADAVAQSYVQFASIVMNVALLYAISRTEATGKVPRPADAYYEGSGALVRFILVCFAIVIMLVPISFGVALYGIGMEAAAYYEVTGIEQVLVIFLALVLALPSLYLMVRYALAPFAVVRDGLRPMAALRRSRIITIGRFWQVAARLVLLFPFMLIISIPSVLVFVGLSYVPLGNSAAVAFQIVATLTVLPIGALYFRRLYTTLEEAFTPAVVEKIEGITDIEKEQLAA